MNYRLIALFLQIMGFCPETAWRACMPARRHNISPKFWVLARVAWQWAKIRQAEHEV